MKEVIRSNAFETNSSSTHSMVICGGEFVKDSFPTNSNDEAEIRGGEFGWGVEKFNDAVTKASYCLSYIMQNQNVDNIESKTFKSSNEAWENFQWDFFTGNERNLAMLVEAIHEVTGKNVKFVNEKGYDGFGYIDHQSSGECHDAFISKENLIAFIFNPESSILISNDNCGWDDDD